MAPGAAEAVPGLAGLGPAPRAAAAARAAAGRTRIELDDALELALRETAPAAGPAAAVIAAAAGVAAVVVVVVDHVREGEERNEFFLLRLVYYSIVVVSIFLLRIVVVVSALRLDLLLLPVRDPDVVIGGVHPRRVLIICFHVPIRPGLSYLLRYRPELMCKIYRSKHRDIFGERFSLALASRG